MEITKTSFVPKGKLITVMADTEVVDTYQLEPDQSAEVIITVKTSLPEETPRT